VHVAANIFFHVLLPAAAALYRALPVRPFCIDKFQNMGFLLSIF